MHRITITLDDDLMASVDAFVRTGGYGSRSEAMRDLARAGLLQHAAPGSEAECVAALVYVYDHEERQLAKRLVGAFHDHYPLTVSTMHVHLNQHECLELSVLRGRSDRVRHFGEHVIAERGVRHGRLVILPNAPDTERGEPA